MSKKAFARFFSPFLHCLRGVCYRIASLEVRMVGLDLVHFPCEFGLDLNAFCSRNGLDLMGKLYLCL